MPCCLVFDDCKRAKQARVLVRTNQSPVRSRDATSKHNQPMASSLTIILFHRLHLPANQFTENPVFGCESVCCKRLWSPTEVLQSVLGWMLKGKVVALKGWKVPIKVRVRLCVALEGYGSRVHDWS